MRFEHSKKHIIGLGALALVAVWVPSAFAATAEERAKCEEMVKRMKLDPVHDHGKGVGSGPMDREHERCKNLLAEPAQGQKKSTDGDGAKGNHN